MPLAASIQSLAKDYILKGETVHALRGVPLMSPKAITLPSWGHRDPARVPC